MSNFPISTIFSAGLFALLVFGLITSNVWKSEGLDAAPIRRMCEAQNITDVQIHECTIRQKMQDAVVARLNQR
ncbi:hypothetical protein JQ621_03015 [Bradyrhizobium manausense]|uniref:hypothetical protein n=1 Tax=Bradyrhizobium manausense TaxID=989370 RepID=UPI001BAD28CC|nr:hypothetical protein [Bradyrhizobium manausense]MBR1086440.1 hypothetical protein [Bradyrhizobium manausense]